MEDTLERGTMMTAEWTISLVIRRQGVIPDEQAGLWGMERPRGANGARDRGRRR